MSIQFPVLGFELNLLIMSLLIVPLDLGSPNLNYI